MPPRGRIGEIVCRYSDDNSSREREKSRERRSGGDGGDEKAQYLSGQPLDFYKAVGLAVHKFRQRDGVLCVGMWEYLYNFSYFLFLCVTLDYYHL